MQQPPSDVVGGSCTHQARLKVHERPRVAANMLWRSRDRIGGEKDAAYYQERARRPLVTQLTGFPGMTSACAPKVKGMREKFATTEDIDNLCVAMVEIIQERLAERGVELPADGVYVDRALLEMRMRALWEDKNYTMEQVIALCASDMVADLVDRLLNVHVRKRRRMQEQTTVMYNPRNHPLMHPVKCPEWKESEPRVSVTANLRFSRIGRG